VLGIAGGTTIATAQDFSFSQQTLHHGFGSRGDGIHQCLQSLHLCFDAGSEMLFDAIL
jgi:hypothetical protein